MPSLLQSLFGYDPLSAGRGTDARWVMAAGLLIMAAGNYWMSQMNLDISPSQVVWPRVVLIVGLACL